MTEVQSIVYQFFFFNNSGFGFMQARWGRPMLNSTRSSSTNNIQVKTLKMTAIYTFPLIDQRFLMKRLSIIRCKMSTLLLPTIYNGQQYIYKKKYSSI